VCSQDSDHYSLSGCTRGYNGRRRTNGVGAAVATAAGGDLQLSSSGRRHRRRGFMVAGLAGKVAIVTGGNSGIGAATVRRLAAEGARIAILARRRPEGEQVQEAVRAMGGEACFIACDVTDIAAIEAAVRETVERYGGLHVLVNNAGGAVQPLNPFPEPNDDTWEQTLRLNLTSVYVLTRLAWPHFLGAGGGVIVNMSSERAVTVRTPAARAMMDAPFGQPAYPAAKAGLEALTRWTASVGGPYNIRCNAVRPGLIATPMTARSTANLFAYADTVQLTLERGYPEDVANAVCFLASDESRFITGQVIGVDGGMAAKV
jgi:3-oxoacyl-[acyl-carrier protein] reductase